MQFNFPFTVVNKQLTVALSDEVGWLNGKAGNFHQAALVQIPVVLIDLPLSNYRIVAITFGNP